MWKKMKKKWKTKRKKQVATELWKVGDSVSLAKKYDWQIDPSLLIAIEKS